MLEGMDETELKAYLDENPRIVPLFEIDIIKTTNRYVATATPEGEEYEPYPESLLELSRVRDAVDREMEISQRVTTSTLEEINVGHHNLCP